jgi:hypothetical protein
MILIPLNLGGTSCFCCRISSLSEVMFKVDRMIKRDVKIYRIHTSSQCLNHTDYKYHICHTPIKHCQFIVFIAEQKAMGFAFPVDDSLFLLLLLSSLTSLKVYWLPCFSTMTKLLLCLHHFLFLESLLQQICMALSSL